MEIPFVFEVGKPTSDAYNDREYLEVQLRDAEQWFYFAERHRRVAQLILDAIIGDHEEAEQDLRNCARRHPPLGRCARHSPSCNEELFDVHRSGRATRARRSLLRFESSRCSRASRLAREEISATASICATAELFKGTSRDGTPGHGG